MTGSKMCCHAFAFIQLRYELSLPHPSPTVCSEAEDAGTRLAGERFITVFLFSVLSSKHLLLLICDIVVIVLTLN